MKRVSIALGAILLGAIACAPASGVHDASPLPLGTGDWTLVELGGSPAVSSEDGMEAAHIRFEADSGRVSGSGGCNRIFGPLTTGADSLRMGPLASTKMACADEAVNRQETAFIEVLDQTRRYNISGDTLLLIGDSGTLARLVAAPGQ